MPDLYIMSLLYIAAGITHFSIPRIYQRIVPPFIPWPKAVVLGSGVAEIVLGASLWFPQLRPAAAWGIMILLILVFPANIYQLVEHKARLGLPTWLLILRLPMQLILIYWASLYR
ncbi:MAG TPA: DoxX family protein [Cryomorphaceae bacterium]|nr:DoxX family protein [Owenweeksia sp.]MBF98459.1 DoxX family protein [Owenweeksia sp.]HAD96054.1 DoxX family protein [Cryomorphaceae bacterium]HBF22110.1 DoxX family protein [Cryomorphaceae bacterium]|tara:strand:+ start:37 stop:381 length:345 start_codon:yes stop_codon:yes gene_type:complete